MDMNYFIYLKNGYTIKFEESIPQGVLGPTDVFAIIDDRQRQVGKLCFPHQGRPYTINASGAVIVKESYSASKPQDYDGYKRMEGGFRFEMRKKYSM